ncbi:MAG: creatininase family protein [Methanosarcinales archaeon]|nr:creatininase family protein [Methanosarcinales archaeon]
MILEEMSWPEIEAGLQVTRTVILPVGATEEHGPHLPTCTDTLQAVEVAGEVARRRDVFVAPALPYGVCRSTRGFPGTISIGQEALRRVIYDLLLAFRETGFQCVLILTGHAGSQHMAALAEAAQRAVARVDLRVSLVTDFEFIAGLAEAPGDGHAGEIETSRMLVLREDLVKGLPGQNFPQRPVHLIMKDVRHLMGNGIMGDPTLASQAKGRDLMEAAVQGVLGVLEELESYPVPR